MNVNFNDKTYELKYSFRALMIYENITGKSFNPKTVGDIIIFFYSVVCSSARPDNIDFDKFVDWLDENPEVINEFSEWLTTTFNVQEKLTPVQAQEEAKKETKKKGKDSEKNS